ncbi:MAG: ComF family protein [Candidatus Liptonbacteria bacterium]|nr:ComF family protein [Candidatus Liptonbacteria bacterium]
MFPSFRILKNFLFDAVFPRMCLGCGKDAEDRESFLCAACRNGLPRAQWVSCGACGGRVASFADFCHIRTSFPIIAAFSYESETVRSLAKHLKYKHIRGIAGLFGAFLADAYGILIEDDGNTIVVPVPLHLIRAWKRGYNQADLIATAFAVRMGLRVERSALVRVRMTRPQTSLSAKRRQDNMRGAFIAPEPARVAGKRIILVDDVFTTGATMREAAACLRHAGAKRVIGLVAARV